MEMQEVRGHGPTRTNTWRTDVTVGCGAHARASFLNADLCFHRFHILLLDQNLDQTVGAHMNQKLSTKMRFMTSESAHILH